MAVDIPIRYSRDDKALKDTIAEWKKLQKEVGVTDKEIDNTKKSTKDLKSETDNLSAGFGNLKGMVGKLGLAAAFGAALIQVQGMVSETAKLRKEISSLTGLGGQDLDKVTSKVKALSDVWKIDLTQAIQASNAAGNAFGKEQGEVLDRIAEGLSKGAEISGEFLDSLREYPEQAKAAGLSFEDFFQILERSAQIGIYSDKGIDAIKEATLRIREMPKATQDAFRAIGMDSERLQAELRAGTLTIFEVIQQTSQRLSELPPQSREVGQAIADIFGGPGEDAGLTFLTLLKDINSEQKDLSETSKRYRELQLQEYEAYQDLNEQLSILGGTLSEFGTKTETFVVQAGAKLLEWVNSFIDATKTAKERAEDLSQSINEGLSTAQVSQELAKVNEEIRKLEEGLASDASIAAGASSNPFAPYTLATDEQKSKFRQDSEEALAEFRKQRDELLDIMRGWEETYDAKNKVDGNEGQSNTNDLTEGIRRQKDEIEKLTASVENGLLNAYEKVYGFRPDNPQSGDDLDSYITMGSDEGLASVANAFEEAEKLKTKKLEEQAEERRKILEGEAEDGRKIYEASIYAIFEITNALAEIRRSKTDEELAHLEEVENSKLSLVGDNAQAQEQIRAETEQKRKESLRREAEANKKIASFEAFINTAAGIAEALPNLVLAGIVGAAGIAQQIAINSRSVPGFKHGTKNVPGIDTGGDTVAAMLRPGEKVFSRETSKAYEPALDAIFDRKITPEVANAVFTGNKSQGGAQSLDINPLIKTLKDNPGVILNINERGYTLHTIQKGLEIEKDVNEFSL